MSKATDKPVMKNVRLSEPHLSMLRHLAAIYGTESQALRVSIEAQYSRVRSMLAPDGSPLPAPPLDIPTE